MQVPFRRTAGTFVMVVALVSWIADKAQAQAPKAPLPVEVVNTPLPITANAPIPVVPSSPIQVVASSPLPVSLQGTVTVRDVDNPARVPYQTAMHIQLDHLEFANVAQIVVPAGKVFVVELVTAVARLPSDQRVRLTMFVSNGFSIVQHFFAPAYVGTDVTQDILTLSQPVRLYTKTAGQNYAIAVNATRFAGSANQGTGSVSISFSGYLLDE